jgi:MFS family permease
LLATLLGGMFLGNVDLAIVNIAAPSIQEDLRASDGALELVVSGYTLAYAMLLITSARLGEAPRVPPDVPARTGGLHRVVARLRPRG